VWTCLGQRVDRADHERRTHNALGPLPDSGCHRRGDAYADVDLRPALDDVTDRDAADRSLPDCRARATRADSCDGADPDSHGAATERTPAAGDAATR